jgi:hypothetical protein
MVGCSSCGGTCSGVCDSKIKELSGIVGPLGTEALRKLLDAADGDINRYATSLFHHELVKVH